MGALALLFLSATALASCDSSSSDDDEDGETEETETDPQPNGCTQSQFACGSGECISNTYVCDGPAQCADGSDEAPVNPECGTPDICEPGEFACEVTQCIPLVQYCNGLSDCDNGADETEACAGCALPDTTPPVDCDSACGDLYDCGIRTCNGAQQCQGFTGTSQERATVVAACLSICNETPALTSLVDPADCIETISNVASINTSFDQACQLGVGG
jgi:hypothetical protein